MNQLRLPVNIIHGTVKRLEVRTETYQLLEYTAVSFAVIVFFFYGAGSRCSQNVGSTGGHCRHFCAFDGIGILMCAVLTFCLSKQDIDCNICLDQKCGTGA